MLTNYARTNVVNASLATKLNITDTTSMLTNYARTNVVNASLATKLNITDTTSMLTNYARTNVVNASLATKLAITDTTVFQRKSLPAYTFVANNTSATASATAQYFKDTSGTYTGTITWSNSNPSGATNHSYRWTRIGNMVTLTISLVYATVSAVNNGSFTVTLPTDAPTPVKPAGLNSSSAYLYPAIGNAGSTLSSIAAAVRGGLRNNATNSGFEIFVTFTGSTTIYGQATVTYFTN